MVLISLIRVVDVFLVWVFLEVMEIFVFLLVVSISNFMIELVFMVLFFWVICIMVL